jgi:hypothetical protein
MEELFVTVRIFSVLNNVGANCIVRNMKKYTATDNETYSVP